ncbi:MAG: aconitate hydratase [Gemmatimonadota bacterium]|nr:MAG: aconitate hydratase [Gemmatimonadota bacterium]
MANIVEKIIKSHLVEGEMVPGQPIAIRIDQTLTQDATGTMAYLQFEAMGIPRVQTELSVSYIDHNTLQEGFENADDHRYLQSVAAKYGIHLSKAGNGICHQVHLERFGKPGKTLLGSDSHTPTGGGIGMIAIGAGGLDVAVAMGGGAFYLTCPRIVKVNLTGQLKPWVSAKDVILKMLEILTTKGNVGSVVEYGGEGVRALSVPERATITNMGAELGVTTSIFPSDETTKAFLKAQGREEDWSELLADPDAEYDRTIDLALGEIVPLLAQPHSPDNICPVSAIAGMKVNQVCIGSCTNSSVKDLMTVAKTLEGKHVHPEVSFVVAPGSKQVLRMISDNGALSTLIAAGARIAETACGFCIGNGMAPQTDAISIRTNNRNFEGRSGTKSAQVYLASPETAAACALKGVITDPRDLGNDTYPAIDMQEQFTIDDSLVFPPSDEPAQVKISRGPNIGDPPANEPLPDSLRGEIMLKVGDKITTDHIMPAGSRLKYRSNVPKYATFVFEPVDPTFATRCVKNKEVGTHNFVLGGMSYGQGSSREHAALCPMYLGVKAVIAKSLERIHTANLINFGILPLTFTKESDYNIIEQGDEVEIPNIRQALSAGQELNLLNETKKRAFRLKYDLSERQKNIILAGGLLNYTKAGGTES